jgi:hypothetical protein
MSKSYLQLVNSCLNRNNRTPGFTVQFLPGKAVSIDTGLTLAFFIPRQLGSEVFPVDHHDFLLEAVMESRHTSNTIVMHHGDCIELRDRLLIWPVAFDIDIHSRQVRNILTRIAPLDPSQSINNLQHLN